MPPGRSVTKSRPRPAGKCGTWWRRHAICSTPARCGSRQRATAGGRAFLPTAAEGGRRRVDQRKPASGVFARRHGPLEVMTRSPPQPSLQTPPPAGTAPPRNRCRSCLAVLGIMFTMNAEAQTSGDAAPPPIKEDDRAAPVDYGFGPGVRPNNNIRAVQEMMAAPSAAAAPAGGADAWTNGVFGSPVTRPIIAIHVVLLPDGRVMNYRVLLPRRRAGPTHGPTASSGHRSRGRSSRFTSSSCRMGA